MSTKKTQVWAVAQFNHTTKKYNVLTGEEGAKYGAVCPESYETFEAAQVAASKLETICNLAFEFPTNEDGSIAFYL
jgi:hypothetical protein